MPFTFIWRIENFGYCWPRTGEVLRSPKFDICNMRWSLAMYPRGRRKADRIDCRLKRESAEYDSELDAEVDFAYLDAADVARKTSERMSKAFAIGEIIEHSVLREDILQRRDVFLSNDTLTLRCRVWWNDDEEDPHQMFASTHIRVDRRTFIWTIKDFSTYIRNQEASIAVPSVTKDSPDFRMKLYPSEGTEGLEKIAIKIFAGNTDKEHFVRCKISLLSKNYTEVESMQDEQWYHRYRLKNPWIFPTFFTRETLLRNKGLYMTGDVLSLRCEFNISLGEWKDVGDNIRPARTPTSSQSTSTTACQTEGLQMTPNSSCLADDLKRLYKEGLFCDFKLSVGSKTFPVHKSVLSARSPVFRVMFEKDMVGESGRGSQLDIADIDTDTLDQMLSFVYSETLDEVGWERAAKLYYAADKYHLTSLKEKCSALLKAYLNPSNAWEVLLLADRHQDEDLRRMVRTFILAQEKTLIESDGEKKAKQRKAINAFHQVYLSATSSQH